MIKYYKIRTCFLYTIYLTPIAALKIGVVQELIWSILRFRRYLGKVSRELPGEVEQSLSPPCVCVRNRRGRAAPLLPLPLPIAHLCVFRQVRWLAEDWRTGPFLPVCRSAQAMLSAFLQLDGQCNTHFQNKQECRIKSWCRLYPHRSLRT